MSPLRWMSFLLLPLAAGCSTPHPKLDDERVQTLVEAKINKQVSWNRNNPAARELDRSIQSRLEGELSLAAIQQIALLKNPAIQASFEEIGIKHADLIEAGLLHNPLFDAVIGYPHSHKNSVSSQVSVAQNFIDLFLIPLRKEAAHAAFEQAILTVANDILKLAFEVERSVIHYQFEEIKRQSLLTIVEIQEAAYELSQKQLAAGNINQIECQERYSALIRSKLELAESTIKSVEQREKIQCLMGLPKEHSWRVAALFPPIPQMEPALADVQSIALSNRLDVQIAKREIDRIATIGDSKKWWSYSDASIGISTEKDSEGIRATGPLFSLALPIFNWGQADRARLTALLHQAHARLNAIEIAIGSHVRSAKGKLLLNRSLATAYHKDILPFHRKRVADGRKYYNAMGIGVYKLLDMKLDELLAELGYNKALADYWLSRVDLDEAMGGSFLLACKPSCEEA